VPVSFDYSIGGRTLTHNDPNDVEVYLYNEADGTQTLVTAWGDAQDSSWRTFTHIINADTAAAGPYRLIFKITDSSHVHDTGLKDIQIGSTTWSFSGNDFNGFVVNDFSTTTTLDIAGAAPLVASAEWVITASATFNGDVTLVSTPPDGGSYLLYEGSNSVAENGVAYIISPAATIQSCATNSAATLVCTDDSMYSAVIGENTDYVILDDYDGGNTPCARSGDWVVSPDFNEAMRLCTADPECGQIHYHSNCAQDEGYEPGYTNCHDCCGYSLKYECESAYTSECVDASSCVDTVKACLGTCDGSCAGNRPGHQSYRMYAKKSLLIEQELETEPVTGVFLASLLALPSYLACLPACLSSTAASPTPRFICLIVHLSLNVSHQPPQHRHTSPVYQRFSSSFLIDVQVGSAVQR
jgi:hypothetical protein